MARSSCAHKLRDYGLVLQAMGIGHQVAPLGAEAVLLVQAADEARATAQNRRIAELEERLRRLRAQAAETAKKISTPRTRTRRKGRIQRILGSGVYARRSRHLDMIPYGYVHLASDQRGPGARP